MTNQEAINIIKTAIAQIEWNYPMDYAAAFDKAITALSAQEPMVPVYDQLLTQEIPRCGKCGYRLVKGNDKYCCRCGQAVKWE